MTLVTAYLTRRSAAERRVFLLARTVFFGPCFLQPESCLATTPHGITLGNL